MTAMAELPFLKADVREIFEIPSENNVKLRRKRRRTMENSQLRRRRCWCCRIKMIKWELYRRKHQKMVQEQVQVDDSPEGAQQLCSSAKLGQGRDHLSSAHLLPPGQQPQDGEGVRVLLHKSQGGMSPNTAPQQIPQAWEAPEVTVQVRPQKLSQGWGSPEVMVQVQPWKPSPGWQSPEVTVQVQLQQQGHGPPLPQVAVQVQPQEQGQGMAGVKVTVQLRLGNDQKVVTCLQDQAEEVLGNGEQLTTAQNQRKPMAGSESEKNLAVVELVPQKTPSQQKDQGDVIGPQQARSQEEEKVEVMELQDMQAGEKADLHGMVIENQMQSQEQEQLKVDLPSQKEGQRATEMRQEQHDAQEASKRMMENKKEDLEQEVSKKRPRETPNYFVSIPITDDQILDRIEDVQELIFTKEPDLLRALLPVQTMHLTIIVAHLGTEEELKKAVLALKQSKTKVEDILQGKDLKMTFHGIGQFNNQVIYVKMLEEDQKMLSRIAGAVEECFIEMNLDISGSRDFKPHLTFLKLSKAPRLKRRGFRKICLDLYREYEDSYFGTEVLHQIDLCAIRKKKQESGYYYCECSINVGSGSSEESKEQEMQTEDAGETSSEDPPNSAVKAEVGATDASCKLALCSIVADDKISENIAGASIAGKEKETEVKGQPKAADGTSLAAGEICSESVLGLLPARSETLKNVEKEQEKAKKTDGSLQKTEATECALDQPKSSD